MNIKLERNLVITGAKNLILEYNFGFQCLNKITLEFCKNVIIIVKIPYLAHLVLEGCEDVTISGCNIDIVDINKTKNYNFLFNIIERLNVDKCSTGNISNSQQK